jgi:hypothetical protein
MSVRQYLPSAQFATLVGALALSAGLVYAAQYVTGRPQGAQLTAATTNKVPSQADWQQTLDEIQLNSGISLPDTPDQSVIDDLVAGVQSSNVTDSVARSLVIKLTNAKAQGLGNDIPTQEQLIAEATAALDTDQAPVYTKADLTSVAQTNDSLRLYGNKTMSTFARHTNAKASTVLLAVGQAVDYSDSKYLTGLSVVQADYVALAADLAVVPVPSTLVPLHLQLVNDIARMASAVGNLRFIVSDPLRGLTGLGNFEGVGDEATRVLTTIAGTLRKGGILFSKDEPGASWSAFVSGT